MYASRTTQLFVGIFALLGIAALVVLSVHLGKVEVFPKPGYMLFANFDNIAGLKTGDQVEIAGVKVGKVSTIALKDNRAQVGMRINEGVGIDDMAIASIFTSGLIGDKYVAVQLGGGDDLKSGGLILHTQSAFVLEDAIGAFITGGGKKDKDSDSGAKKDGDTGLQSGGTTPSTGDASGTSPSPAASGGDAKGK
jgi:phospholipid/cholesterol/gamma-HCH transport system substrate-binding protein